VQFGRAVVLVESVNPGKSTEEGKWSGRFETPLQFVWGRARGSVIIGYLNATLNTVNTVAGASVRPPLNELTFWLGRHGSKVGSARKYRVDSIGQFLSGVGL
jgi:hypothetical protein